MPNLIITNVCNLQCPFCFATESRTSHESSSGRHMSPAEFGRRLRWLGSERVKFCGGEPTLHPDFIELLEMALAAPGAPVVLMTNGMWPDDVRRHIARLPPRKSVRLTILFNVLAPALYRQSQEKRLAESLAVVNPYTSTLGVTIYRQPFDYSYVIKLARERKIPRIRFSIAAPNLSNIGSWGLVPERDFPVLARSVVRFAEEARLAGISLRGDCGYLPQCAFAPEDLVQLSATPDVMSQCHTSAVDIGVGGQSWRCYGLYSVLGAEIDEFETPDKLQGHFDRRVRLLEDFLLFPDCAECRFRATRECLGGCYALRVARQLERDPDTCLFPVDDDEQLLGCEPVFIGKLKGVFQIAPERYRVFVAPSRPQVDQRVEWELSEGAVRLLEGAAPGRTVREWIPELAGLWTPAARAQRFALDLLRALFANDHITFKRREGTSTDGPRG